MQTSSARSVASQVPFFVDRETILLEHLPQIKCVARKICAKLPASIDANDLIGDGILGLLDAVEKFDPARGVSFKTYAQYRIRGAILDSLRNQDWTPRSMRQKSRRLASTKRSMEVLLGRPPSEEEIAKAMDLSLEKLHELVGRISKMRVKSLSDTDLLEDVACNEMPHREGPSNPADPFTSLVHSEIRCLLGAALEELPDREKTIISLYYYEDLTMTEISKILNLNPSRISQIHSRAMMRLRPKLFALAMQK